MIQPAGCPASPDSHRASRLGRTIIIGRKGGMARCPSATSLSSMHDAGPTFEESRRPFVLHSESELTVGVLASSEEIIPHG